MSVTSISKRKSEKPHSRFAVKVKNGRVLISSDLSVRQTLLLICLIATVVTGSPILIEALKIVAGGR